MAREKKRIIEIDTGSASKSVSQLKEEISGLKQQLDAQNLSEQEATRLTGDLTNAQKILAESTEFVKVNSEKLGKTYTALQENLKKLKTTYKETANEAEKSNVADQMNKTSSAMREMSSASTSSGNTMGEFGNILSQLGGSTCKQLVSGISGVTEALTILKAHPIIAVIAIVVASITKLVQKFKENEQAVKILTDSLAPLRVITETINKLWEKLFESIAKFIALIMGKLTQAIEWVTKKMAKLAEGLHMKKLAASLNDVVSKMEQAKTIVDETNKLEERQNQIIKENADLNTKLAELEAERQKAEEGTTKELELQKQIDETRLKIAQNNFDVAKKEYELLKLNNKVHGSSKAKLEKEQQAYVKMKKAEADLIKANTKAYKTTKEEISALEGSYNALSKQLGILKDKWKATNDEAERAKIAEQIKDVDKQMRNLEAGLGDSVSRFRELGTMFEYLGIQGSNSVVSGLKNINAAAKILYANPIFALVAVLAAIIMGIVKSIMRNEKALDRLKIALGPVQGLFRWFQENASKLANLISKVLTGAIEKLTNKIRSTATFLANVASKLGLDDLAEKLGRINETMDKQADITKSLIELNHKKDDIARDNADLELEISKLQADFIRNEGNLQKQKEITNKIDANTLKIRQNNLELAKEEYRVAELNKDGSEERNQAADEAYVRMKQAEAEIYQLTKEQRKVIKQEAKEVKEVETELDKLLKKLEEFRQSEEDQILLLVKQYEQELNLLGNNYAAIDLLTKKWIKERKELELNNAKDTINTITNLYEEAGNTISKTYLDSLQKAEEDFKKDRNRKSYNESIYKAETEQLQQRKQASEEYIHQLQLQRDAMIQNGLDTVEIDKLITAAELERSNLTLDILEREREEWEKLYDQKWQAYKDDLDLLAEYASAISSIGEGISGEWANVFSTVSKGLSEIQESIKQGEEGWQTYSKIAVTGLQTAAMVMNALADEQDETTEEGFKKQQSLQIASATMTMLAGIVSAMVNSIRDLGVPAGPIVGAALSAMIAGLGGAQIAAIKKQKFGDNNTSAATVNSGAMKSILAPVQYTSNIPSAYSETEASDQRVYVLESDITSVQRKVSVTESESRF